MKTYRKKHTWLAIIAAFLAGVFLLGAVGVLMDENKVTSVKETIISKKVDISKDVTTFGSSTVLNGVVSLDPTYTNRINVKVESPEKGLYAFDFVMKFSGEKLNHKLIIDAPRSTSSIVSNVNTANVDLDGFVTFRVYQYMEEGANTFSMYTYDNVIIKEIKYFKSGKVDTVLDEWTTTGTKDQYGVHLSSDGTTSTTATCNFYIAKDGTYDFTMLAGGKQGGTYVKFYDSNNQLIRSFVIEEPLNKIAGIVPDYNPDTVGFADPGISMEFTRGAYRVEIVPSTVSNAHSVNLHSAYLTVSK